MSQSSTEEPPELNMWTKEDVHQWLMNVVKVPQSCADLFLEHEINGEALNEIEKSYILKLEIPHGPAVKISHYLERLKKGSQHQPQFQSEAENWTKEKVAQWIVGHGKATENSRVNATIQNQIVLKGQNKQAGKNLPMRKTTEVKCQKPAPLIKDNLDGLSTSDFNNFKFHLNHYTDPECTAIPLCKLEGKDTSDIATVVTSHYGPDKALRETKLRIL
ncbi:Sterile alpha motif domain containing protein 9 [Dissostichus eleginoides]|uniref:Sterile alpha motif domain containing protein 9 n=1 Tax=Dissostichus eleginoides TaxID=100907 RepID=A0AAD9C4Z6_DISEL|nr:Sterile alpha motif domain containing protein 9 [Dissostichus eleginoides]